MGRRRAPGLDGQRSKRAHTSSDGGSGAGPFAARIGGGQHVQVRMNFSACIVLQ